MSLPYPELYWLIIGVTLLLLELALPGFIIFFFGLGALFTSCAAWLLPPENFPIAWQLAMFLVTSLLSLVALRGIILRKFFTPSQVDKDAKQKEQGEDVIHARPGEKAIVTLAISPPAEGQLKYGGTFWRATADEAIAAGEPAVIIRQHELVIHVKKWKGGK